MAIKKTSTVRRKVVKKTPEASTSLKTPKITKGAASIIFFYFGDSKFTTICQETVKLKKAMEDYKYKVLLKHNEIPSWLDLSEKDEKIADVKEAPTKDNLVKYVKQLADEGYMIDLWIFSHGWEGGFRASTGKHGSKGSFTKNDIETLLGSSATGFTNLPIRMVYQVNCYGKSLNESWQSIGAKMVTGARYVNFYPNQFGNFANKWNKGNVSFEDAVDKSDTAASRTVVQTYISMVHAPSVKSEWGGCPLLKTVLGDHKCAKKYFTNQWLEKDEWQDGKSGKENMNYSSRIIIKGEKNLTKDDVPKWD